MYLWDKKEVLKGCNEATLEMLNCKILSERKSGIIYKEENFENLKT